MNSKERMMHVLTKGSLETGVPVTPHWWGLYKFTPAGLVHGYEDEGNGWKLGGADLAKVDRQFYNTFRPDMFHLTTAPARNIDPKKMEEAWKIKPLAARLDSKSAIDEYISLLWRSKEEVLAGGEFDHVAQLVKEYGDSVLITVNEGINVAAYLDPHGYVGFEDGLIGLLQEPENSAYYISRIMDMTLERVKALAELGCHGYISSETYCSADLISPRMYRDIIFPLHQKFFTAVDNMGVVPIGYFTGDIIPMLEDIKQLRMGGLMVEESKKGFRLDVGDIAARLENVCALFGNLDSVEILQDGTEEDVINETLRQLEATRGHRFIMANGCPVSFGTPRRNVAAMLETARQSK